MDVTFRANSLRRSLLFDQKKATGASTPLPLPHRKRVLKDLRRLGVTPFAMVRAEFDLLPQLIHPYETIEGIVYGHYSDGFAVLLATNMRVLFVDKKLFFTREDEVTYDVVSGVSIGKASFFTTVTLHTRVKDYKLRTLNFGCAADFVAYIESHRIEKTRGILL